MASHFFNKKLGQHILINQNTISAIIDKAKIKSTDTVLEVGGGTGNLTLKLLEKAKKVICYEKDPRLALELVKKVNTAGFKHKFELIVGDALKHDFPCFDLCVSNTPYQISSPLVFKLLQYKFKAAILMFQKEFADRLIARPGDKNWCRLSVAVQILAKTSHELKVPKNSFRPTPKVESSVVKIMPRHCKPNIDLNEFNRLLKMCFLRRNKTLGSIFKGKGVQETISNQSNNQENTEAVINVILRSLQIEKARAAKMEIEDFLALLLEFKKSNVDLK